MTDETRPLVETEFALVWRCPQCRAGNRVRVMPAELGEDEREEFRLRGINARELQEMKLVSVPCKGTCGRCKFKVALMHPADGEINVFDPDNE